MIYYIRVRTYPMLIYFEIVTETKITIFITIHYYYDEKNGRVFKRQFHNLNI